MTDFPTTPRLRPLFSMRLAVEQPLPVARPERIGWRIAGIVGGTFEGERLGGVVLAGGTDWQKLGSDGAIRLDARIVLKTDDGALIAMTYRGIRHGPTEVMATLARGEQVDPELYYFRIVPTFSTTDLRYEWLNHIIALGTGDRMPEGPIYSVHEVV